MKIYHEGVPLIVKLLFNHMVLQDHVTNENQYMYIYTTTVPMTTKLDRVVTYLEELLRIKSEDPLIMRSYKIT